MAVGARHRLGLPAGSPVLLHMGFSVWLHGLALGTPAGFQEGAFQKAKGGSCIPLKPPSRKLHSVTSLIDYWLKQAMVPIQTQEEGA